MSPVAVLSRSCVRSRQSCTPWCGFLRLLQLFPATAACLYVVTVPKRDSLQLRQHNGAFGHTDFVRACPNCRNCNPTLRHNAGVQCHKHTTYPELTCGGCSCRRARFRRTAKFAASCGDLLRLPSARHRPRLARGVGGACSWLRAPEGSHQHGSARLWVAPGCNRCYSLAAIAKHRTAAN